jgi:Gnt-I system high-affinity gluconate transporter
MPVLLALGGIVALILLITYFKLDTFISFILVALGLGLAAGMSVPAIGKSIQAGIGSTLGDLVLIIGFGAMLGKLVADSGAAQRITQAIIAVFGVRHVQWGLALAGFIIGLPLFYNAGFIIVVPLIFAVANSTRLPILYVAIPMCSALSVAHGYLPPHPSPVAIAAQVKADLGLTLLYGILIAIPAIVVAGPLFGRTLRRYAYRPGDSPFQAPPEADPAQLPSLGVSLLTTLLPLLLFGATVAIKPLAGTNPLLQLLAEPYIGMLLSVLLAVYLLGLRQGQTMKATMKRLEEAFKATSTILLIVAGAGALKQVLNDSQISRYIGEQLQYIPLSPLVLSWGIAGAIRVAVGSATVAGLTTVGVLAPLIAQGGAKPELMVLAVGAGSLMLSHLNDAGFWLFKEYFNLTIRETLQTWTVMETLVSVIGLIGVLLLDLVV